MVKPSHIMVIETALVPTETCKFTDVNFAMRPAFATRKMKRRMRTCCIPTS